MKRKFIVAHANPDQDAVTSVWLIKRFWVGWENAESLFVPAGETLQSFRKSVPTAYSSIDTSDAEVVHVDTGFGEFDHHQNNDFTCATKKIYESTIRENAGRTIDTEEFPVSIRKANNEVLERMVNFINEIDHFKEVYYHDVNNDRYQFLLSAILDGLNLMYNTSGTGDIQVVSFGMTALDGIYRLLQNKVSAEKEFNDKKPVMVKIAKGEAIGFDTSNDIVLDIAQKNGYYVAIRKDPKKGYIRIKSLPDCGINLTKVYEQLKQMDTKATWFLHASNSMLLNGSTKNPKMRPTSLTLEQIMKVIEKELS